MTYPHPFPGRIVIAGAGNVGTHLAIAFHQAGVEIGQIYSRTRESAMDLAKQVGCGFTTSPAEIDRSSGAIILTLNDSAILSFLQQTGALDMMLIHTAGSISMDILRPYAKRCGVLYPLQTISRGVPIDLSYVPFLIEASDEDSLAFISSLASLITGRVITSSSDERLRYHLAAVFCNNFSNHMMALAEEWLIAQGLTFDMLESLVRETARKALAAGPAHAQTGPALRNNIELLELHQGMLKDFPDLQKMYTFVSDSIRRKYSLKEKDDQ